MPLIITPRQLAQRSEIYHQLGSLLSAGVGLISALQGICNAPTNPSTRRALSAILEQLQQGERSLRRLRR